MAENYEPDELETPNTELTQEEAELLDEEQETQHEYEMTSLPNILKMLNQSLSTMANTLASRFASMERSIKRMAPHAIDEPNSKRAKLMTPTIYY